MTSSLPTVQRVIQNALEVSQLKYSQHPRPGGAPPALIVELPGERKLKINTILSVGEHSVRVEAFVCRKPDETGDGLVALTPFRTQKFAITICAFKSLACM
ncbi:Protein of uncharacterised function (DUF2596) [Mycobacterium tuberculosis]|nr:Protein of uncharacterised function (DUF2596) [Mycobacterium tuberculosis]SGB00795.1 Protein of uncharacterised function (DUF2596) [Mycobacterium tuberculosis]SGC68476.1 Protein of uncharacterised function (DUF2596) [Mycobacterium tuberculosis]SGD24960.1 Protein of uncharacterised function (DUF2596) [Mycobacterium tuberculosis]SGD41432.1 Protein of uncharacterised function (DUF2596) [Mycobacterium tuberculosis]